MEVLSGVQMAQRIAILSKRPVLYLSGLDYWLEGDDPESFIDSDGRLLAAPYLNIHDEHSQLFADGHGIVICESEEELNKLYELTYGDDGLTERGRTTRERYGYPLYKGKYRVYALTISKDGELGAENT